MSLRNRIKAVLPRPLWRVLSAIKQYVWLVRSVPRLRKAYYGQKLVSIRPIVMSSRETSDFTYDLTARNLLYLVELVACVTRRHPSEIAAYIAEAIGDAALNEAASQGAPARRYHSSPFGRRLGWYAIARATKPRVIVETGVSRGYGAIILCAALLKNAAEGAPGRYFGTDNDLKAGFLLTGNYATVGKILYGDSIQSLLALDETIGLFINDSEHAGDYEAREYRAIAGKLAPGAILLADNAHATDMLAVFSREMGRSFLYFQEEPKDHWYPGAGIGISFPAPGAD